MIMDARLDLWGSDSLNQRRGRSNGGADWETRAIDFFCGTRRRLNGRSSAPLGGKPSQCLRPLVQTRSTRDVWETSLRNAGAQASTPSTIRSVAAAQDSFLRVCCAGPLEREKRLEATLVERWSPQQVVVQRREIDATLIFCGCT